MSTFTQLKANVRSNLNDTGSGTFYASGELDNSFQDAYDDICARSQCITKKTSLNWIAGKGYLFLAGSDFAVTDWLATLAIFDQVTNRWLLDSLSVRGFLKFRPDWELVVGSPIYWAPMAPNVNVIFPKYSTNAGAFDLYYAATAPTVVDGDTPLIPTDKQCLLEQYSTADLLESAEEYGKASHYWQQYFEGIESLKNRFKNLAKSDLLSLA